MMTTNEKEALFEKFVRASQRKFRFQDASEFEAYRQDMLAAFRSLLDSK